jgi:hypothetical protein
MTDDPGLIDIPLLVEGMSPEDKLAALHDTRAIVGFLYYIADMLEQANVAAPPWTILRAIAEQTERTANDVILGR